MAKNYLTPDEIERVLEHLGEPYDLISEIQVWTGRRPSEVLMVEKTDIDHEKKIIEFVQLKKRGRKIENEDGSISYARKRETRPVDCKAFYGKLIEYLRTVPIGELYVFPSPRNDGDHLGIRILQKKVKEAGEIAGVPTHPHIFRHSFAVQYLEKKINEEGMDPIQAVYNLKEILGHKSLDTTMRYLSYVTGREDLSQLWDR